MLPMRVDGARSTTLSFEPGLRFAGEFVRESAGLDGADSGRPSKRRPISVHASAPGCARRPSQDDPTSSSTADR